MVESKLVYALFLCKCSKCINGHPMETIELTICVLDEFPGVHLLDQASLVNDVINFINILCLLNALVYTILHYTAHNI